tara:strand:- start:135 stop:317 length:183 start_codon:yes stop_codon:yes gene_type:complete
MNETMKLTEEEKIQLLKTKSEKEWYKVCNQIKERRNGQYPNYLSRQILDLYQEKFEVDYS